MANLKIEPALTIRYLSALRPLADTALAEPGNELSLDLGESEQLDGAGFQFLCALREAASKRGKRLVFEHVEKPLEERILMAGGSFLFEPGAH